MTKGKSINMIESKKRDKKQHGSVRCSLNEIPVDTLDNDLKSLIKVIKPSRASLTYERME